MILIADITQIARDTIVIITALTFYALIIAADKINSQYSAVSIFNTFYTGVCLQIALLVVLVYTAL